MECNEWACLDWARDHFDPHFYLQGWWNSQKYQTIWFYQNQIFSWTGPMTAVFFRIYFLSERHLDIISLQTDVQKCLSEQIRTPTMLCDIDIFDKRNRCLQWSIFICIFLVIVFLLFLVHVCSLSAKDSTVIDI